MSLLLLKVIVTTVFFYYVPCETTKCDGKTCSLCIGESIECVWCPAANHTGPRCKVNETNHPIGSSWCSEEVQNPLPKKYIESIRNDSFSAVPDHEVQLTPQDLKISVRPGQIVEFPLKYKPAKHYPLDVYFLMDVSYTMENTIQLLKEQGKLVYDILNKYTNNVHMGIGSFIEKAALPYGNPERGKMYSFKHHFNLTAKDKEDSFGKSIKKIVLGENADDPEAGLDALMQVMVCNEKLGWRKGARKIVVFCTDSTYHSAGDGKIAGAAKLNDMECHLENDTYTLELEQDYPSVNQIRQIARKENIIILFYVKANVMHEYRALAERLNIGAEVTELKAGSSIEETIVGVYTEKLGNVKMEVTVPDKVRVKLTPDCILDNNCEVEHDKDISIQVQVTADVCLGNNSYITIKPHDLNESLRIKIETLCKCDCENRSISNADVCSNGNGSLVCGVCSCNHNRFGEKCDCVGSDEKKHLEKCKESLDHTVVCGGIERGSCQCGICHCKEFYTGNFCQFDKRACLVDEVECRNNGKCVDGHCKCFPDWTGDTCDCPLDVKDCRAPYSTEVCSGNGKCECGKCNCTRMDSKNKLYFGAFCDNCHDCDGKRCKDLEEYVKCLYNNQGKKEVCDEKFSYKNTIVFMVNKTKMNAPEYHLAKRCTIVLDDGKSIVFKHKYEGKILHIIIQLELEEPDHANMWIAIGSAIGAILLIGLLTVILWKILVDMYDAREYDRFNKMLDESGDLENINQIYQPATANFINPLFKRQSRIN